MNALRAPALTRTVPIHRQRFAALAWPWVFFAFFLPISVPSVSAQWTVTHFGTGQMTTPFDVRIGKARNDGTNRVYVSERNGRILEWSYQNGSWSMSTLVQAVSNLALIAMGDVHNDGTNRLYYTEFHKFGDLYELTWTGKNWQRVTIDQDRSSLNLFIGAGRNDGYQRLYVGGVNTTSPVNTYTGLWEYTWATGVWQKVRLHSTPMEGRGLVGNLRSDGTRRVLANGVGNAPSFFYEYTWNGSTYIAGPIDVSNAALAPDPTDLGTPRNDARMRVIANTQQGKREYTWNGSSWQALTIDAQVRRGDIRVARTKADGLDRIYSTHAGTATPKPPLIEFTWNALLSKYESNTVVDAVTGATAMMTVGNGRNDGVARLYAPNYAGGEMLEITSTNPFTYATPNPLLRLHGIATGPDSIVVTLSNLTPRCSYRIARTAALTQTWQSVSTFIAQGITTNWVDTPSPSAAFYRLIGMPQAEP